MRAIGGAAVIAVVVLVLAWAYAWAQRTMAEASKPEPAPVDDAEVVAKARRYYLLADRASDLIERMLVEDKTRLMFTAAEQEELRQIVEAFDEVQKGKP